MEDAIKTPFGITVQGMLHPVAHSEAPGPACPWSLVLNQCLHFVDKVSGYPQDLRSIVVLSHF